MLGEHASGLVAFVDEFLKLDSGQEAALLTDADGQSSFFIQFLEDSQVFFHVVVTDYVEVVGVTLNDPLLQSVLTSGSDHVLLFFHGEVFDDALGDQSGVFSDVTVGTAVRAEVQSFLGGLCLFIPQTADLQRLGIQQTDVTAGSFQENGNVFCDFVQIVAVRHLVGIGPVILVEAAS